jgi:hypothetical protein
MTYFYVTYNINSSILYKMFLDLSIFQGCAIKSSEHTSLLLSLLYQIQQKNFNALINFKSKRLKNVAFCFDHLHCFDLKLEIRL